MTFSFHYYSISGGLIMDDHLKQYREMISLRGLTNHTINSYSAYMKVYLTCLSDILHRSRKMFPTVGSWMSLIKKWLFPYAAGNLVNHAGSLHWTILNSSADIWCMYFRLVFRRSVTMDSWITGAKVKTWNWSSLFRDISVFAPDIPVCRWQNW